MLNPGLYLPQLPKLPKLELRVEGFKAEPRLGTIYFDRRYRSGYTNDGNLIGSWIGRQAQGGQAWIKYSFTARKQLATRVPAPGSGQVSGGRRTPERLLGRGRVQSRSANGSFGAGAI